MKTPNSTRSRKPRLMRTKRPDHTLWSCALLHSVFHQRIALTISSTAFRHFLFPNRCRNLSLPKECPFHAQWVTKTSHSKSHTRRTTPAPTTRQAALTLHTFFPALPLKKHPTLSTHKKKPTLPSRDFAKQYQKQSKVLDRHHCLVVW